MQTTPRSAKLISNSSTPRKGSHPATPTKRGEYAPCNLPLTQTQSIAQQVVTAVSEPNDYLAMESRLR